MALQFEWDENKRLNNIRKHGIDFVDAVIIFENDNVIIEDDRFNYNEQRFIALGLLQGWVIVIVYTEREDIIRIISARKATKYEQRTYFEQIAN
ncbi:MULTISPECIES: BrnT family toxin [unclassified Anabaena]|uniref:BrnT family toxin n=1 Tax=unclassified Anabaena TaxID=2619674 RepID=UPI0014477DF7|nr:MULTISPECIES: BrnT family toxin [unclassified Anabaena]MTJ08227.1 BrnT family toxin [Anabaena sp. UHCC 0204]MTJ53456.1 BrnT family toxin [Anabaena sp. UHCC 0253]